MGAPEPLVGSIQVSTTPSFLGSDWHFKTPNANRENTPANIARQVIANADRKHSGERHLYCLGDIYDVREVRPRLLLS